MVVKMETQIMIKHENSEELSDLLKQLEEQSVRQVGSIERIDDWSRLADSGLNKTPMNSENYSYGIVISTIPEVDFHTIKLSRRARESRCYEYHKKGKHNVIDGQRYYDFTQDLASRIALPEGWKFMSPKFVGFAMDSTWPSGTHTYYGGGGKFELCGSLSLAKTDPDNEKIKESVCGGILGKGSHFGKVASSWSGGKWQHLGNGMVLFPVYLPAVIGRMYREGKIKTKREFVDSNENSRDIQESSVNINCLEVIAIYPDKKVLESVIDSIHIDGGLVRAFLTYHPNYQFQWSKAAEKHAFIEDRKIRHGKVEYGSPPIDE